MNCIAISENASAECLTECFTIVLAECAETSATVTKTNVTFLRKHGLLLNWVNFRNRPNFAGFVGGSGMEGLESGYRRTS